MTNAEKQGLPERGSRLMRNIHAAGALALAGAAVLVPPLAPVATAGAAFETIHAAGWEVARRHFGKRRGK